MLLYVTLLQHSFSFNTAKFINNTLKKVGCCKTLLICENVDKFNLNFNSLTLNYIFLYSVFILSLRKFKKVGCYKRGSPRRQSRIMNFIGGFMIMILWFSSTLPAANFVLGRGRSIFKKIKKTFMMSDRSSNPGWHQFCFHFLFMKNVETTKYYVWW